MFRCLFWNIKQNTTPLMQAALARLVVQYQVDVLVLAENEMAPDALLDAIKQRGVTDYRHAPDNSQRITLFTRYPPKRLLPVYESDYQMLSVFRIICRYFFN